jgi:hypothetical protein
LRGVPIEILNGIRTRRGTISATNASVIDLSHKTFFIDVGSIDWADLGARRIVAMHARPGKQSGLDMRIFPLNIRDQFYPADRATFRGFFGSDDPHVVFRLAGDHASLTGSAFI